MQKKSWRYSPALLRAIAACEKWFGQHPDICGHEAIVCVSGGVDSMLLWAVCEQIGSRYFSDIRIAHVSYPMRKAAAVETAFLQSHAQTLRRPIDLTRVTHEQMAQGAGSDESRARDIRMHFFKSLAQDSPDAKLLGGRQGSDVLEDVWLRMYRQPTPWTWHTPQANEITLYTPLEALTRQEVRAAYQCVGWPAYEDYTNTSLRVARNILRTRLEHEPCTSLGNAPNTTHHALRLTREWESLVKTHLLEKIATHMGQDWLDQSIFDLSKLRTTHPELLSYALWHWMSAQAQARGVNTAVFLQVLRALDQQQFPKTFEFPELGEFELRKHSLARIHQQCDK